MLVGILHLSDVHIKEGRNVILNRKEKIIDAVKNDFMGYDAFVIITSGDIAFSGSKTEYAKAREFFSYLQTELAQYMKVTDGPMLFIPGNHDCAFDTSKEKIRILVLKNFSANGFDDIDESLIDTCCEPQESYFQFEESIPTTGDKVYSSKLLKILQFKFGEYFLKFNLYNTSWHSTLKESIGTMGFPTEYLYGRTPMVHNDYSISLIHHPFNWQTPEHSRKFRESLLKTSDIVISGHEHAGNLNVLSDFEGDYSTVHVESAALQDSDNENNSSFNFIGIDLENRRLSVRTYIYDTGNGRYTCENDSQKVIAKNRKLKTKFFQIKSEFLRGFLLDPGATFVHSSGEDITLDKIFVSPILNNVSPSKERQFKFINFVNSDSALSIDGDNFYKVIFGDEGSGKTTLLKHVFLEHFNKNFFPVYIDASAFRDVTVEKLKKFVLREMAKQYDELDGKFESVDFNKVVLLVDDFHKLRNKGAKPFIISNLCKIFSKIIVVGNQLLQFDSYTDSKTNKQIEVFDQFDRYIMQEFGPQLRNALITRWYRLGRDYMDNAERNEFFRKIDFAENSINTIIGKNLIPAHPVYILSILQALESGQTDTKSNNLHSYYYEYLINESMKKAIKDRETVGFYQNLAKEYCYFLFTEKIRFQPLSQEDFNRFLANHYDRLDLTLVSPEKDVQTLIAAKIIKRDGSDIAISHKYIYYYFVAKYLADNLDNPDTKKVIELMTERVYREEYSNIIIFLTYLSKNKFIIDKLIENSRQIFKECEVMRLEDDITFINELHQSIPKQIINEMNVEDARQADVEHREEYERREKVVEDNLNDLEEYDLTEDTSTLDVISQLTKAITTLNIIGNITRMNWGEMLGDPKYDMAEETYLLGLRVLKFYFGMMNDSKEELIKHIKSIINKKYVHDSLQKSDVEAITSNFLFSLSSVATFGIVKRVANSIGTSKLTKTFTGIEANHPYNSVKIINASIKLDHAPSFPMQDIEQLAKHNENNPLGFNTIQNLVIDHLYMYELPLADKQRIYSKLNIHLRDQRFIEGTTQIRKND